MSIDIQQQMTLDEFHQLPDDPEVDRILLYGQLIERPTTKRNQRHAVIESRVAHILWRYADEHPVESGFVFSGEVGCDFVELNSGCGIDVAYFASEVVHENVDRTFIEGIPVLAVEILSPSDSLEGIYNKVEMYIEAGVKMVWTIDPATQILTVFGPPLELCLRRGQPYKRGQDFSCDPVLPGLIITIDDVFRGVIG